MKYIQDFFLASSEPSSLCISNSQSASSVNNQLQLPSAVVNISTERAESRIKDIQAAVHMYVGGGKESQIYRLAGCARRDTNKLHIDVDFQNDKYLLDDQGKRTYTSFFNEFHKSDNGSIGRIIAQKKLQQQCPKGKKDLDIFVSSVLHTQLASAAPFAANNRSDMSINNRINLIEDVSKVPLSKIIHITNVSEKKKKTPYVGRFSATTAIIISLGDEIYSKRMQESRNGKGTRNFLCDYYTLSIAENQPQYNTSTIDMAKSRKYPPTGSKTGITASKG